MYKEVPCFTIKLLSVCDNCTLTLLARTDELTEILEEGSNHIDLSGVPAPWPRLLSYENRSVFIEQRLSDFYSVQTYVEEFDDDVIEKVRLIKKDTHSFALYETLKISQLLALI